ncbi:MAG: penicillin-binding protein 1C [Chloroflexota bacterium]
MKRSLLILILVGVLAALGAAGWAWLFSGLPSVETLPARLNTPSVRITDRQGRLLYEALPTEGGRHAVVALEQIPLALRQATIATEDRSFYSHPGVDWQGILRAAWINLRGSETRVGGSTITQQVARNLLMEQEERYERSYRRKLREALLAWQLTRSLSKEEVLGLYLNQTYYGGMAYGAEAAAQTFFGKPAAQLDLAECALLAGLPQAPAPYNPFTDMQAAQARQKVVLGLMEADGYITAEQRALAEREPLVLAESPYPIEAPHFVMMVRAQLDEIFTPEQIYQHGGLVVRTTLDLDWQGHAERAIAQQLEELRRTPDGLGHNVNNAALVALDPQTGEILALVGSPDYFDAEHGGAINMANAPRQPGSALKPLVYAAAMNPQQAQPWTAATMLLDVTTSFLTPQGQAYVPANYDFNEHGPVLLRDALASSLNIPAVLTMQHVGLPELFALASRLGITTLKDPEAYNLSLALGGGEVRLLELVQVYGAFANGGYQVTPETILEVSDWQGNLLYQAAPMPQARVLDERLAWLISDILSDNDARRLGFGAYSSLRLDRPAAVKTGTTTNFHDNWTVGYTPGLVVGVWAGNTDYRPMRDVSGLTGAAPIWHQFMRTVLRDQPPQAFAQPPGLARVEICALSGLLPTQACPYRRWEWFIEGTQPTRRDNLYRVVTLDSATGRLATASTPPERRIDQVVLDLPIQAQAWARSQGLALYSDLLPGEGVELGQAAPVLRAGEALRMLAPATGSVYVLSTGLTAGAQRIRLEAVGAAGLRQVVLYVDGQAVASFAGGPYQAWWELSLGSHRAWAEAVGEAGEKVTSEVVTFVVQTEP